jgi:amino acid transporter
VIDLYWLVGWLVCLVCLIVSIAELILIPVGMPATIFIIFTPIFSEGANLSGDLKDPASAIGKGTLAAVGTAILTYAVLIFSMSAGFPRETLRHNMSPMQDVAPSKYLLIIGIIISTCSSGMSVLLLSSCVTSCCIISPVSLQLYLPGCTSLAAPLFQLD